jgi:cyclic pyranopterin phosphate synthase
MGKDSFNLALRDLQPMTLRDGFNRQVSYLRLSVTDRCNLRCTYCMPAEGIAFAPSGDLLTRGQFVRLAQVAVDLGVRKIRVTGGEPLLRPDIVELLGEIGDIGGLEHLALTTNGVRLAGLAGPLRKAGVHGVNISLDSLRPGRFADITRGGSLTRCLQGLDAALAVGLEVKLNVVVMRGINSDEILEFAELARDLPLEVRYIEHMPTREGADEARLTVPAAEILDTIAACHGLETMESPLHSGPARRFKVPGWVGTIGVISAVSCHFCEDCNRIRVTASGQARSCLFHEAGLDLKPWLTTGDDAGLAAAFRQAVAIKPESHDLGPDGRRGDEGTGPIIMSRLGG